MTTLERFIAYGAILAMLVIGIPWYFEHRGAKECVQAQAAVVAGAEIHNAEAEAVQTADDKKAGEKLNAALTNPVGDLPPTTSLQQQACPSSVPNPRSHPAPSATAVPVRTEAPPSVVQPNWNTFERSDVQDSHDADAQVTYLQGLLLDRQRLCGGK